MNYFSGYLREETVRMSRVFLVDVLDDLDLQQPAQF